MIEIKQQPLSESLKKWIYDGFSRHSMKKMGHDEKSDPIAFIANDKDHPVGAIVVEIFWGALHIKYLYVEEQYRGQKLASKLMKKALDYGIANKSPFAFVETMSFQAIGFYQKMGFELEFTRSGYNHETSFHYLRKNL